MTPGTLAEIDHGRARRVPWMMRRLGPRLRASHFFRLETLVFFVFWLLLLVGGQSRAFKDPGSLWHIVVGERILSSGALPHTDSFSFTFAGKPFIAQWWLGECILALVHRIGGLDAILLAAVTIQALFLSWLAYRFLRAGIHPLLACLLTGLTFLGIAFHFHPRPHLITIVLMAWTFARLCDFEAGRVSLRGLFWFIPVYIFWTNVHGGMVGGVATLALALGGWSLARWLTILTTPTRPVSQREASGTVTFGFAMSSPRSRVGLVCCPIMQADGGWHSPLQRKKDFLGFGALVLACALTALVNPYGAELPRVWFALFRSPVLPALIEEHAPLLAKSVGWFDVVLGLIYVAALLGVPLRKLRVTWLIPLVWLYLAWGRSRHGPLFAGMSALALAEIIPHVRWTCWLAARGNDLWDLNSEQAAQRGRIIWGPMALAALLLGTGWGLQAASVEAPLLGRGWARLDSQEWPVELLPELTEYERTHQPGTPVFNDMLFGGFLIYHTPDLRVFIDDRCEVYGDQQLLAYKHALFEDPSSIEHWRQQHHFDLALVVPQSKFDEYLATSPGWAIVRRTQAAVLYRWLQAE